MVKVFLGAHTIPDNKDLIVQPSWSYVGAVLISSGPPLVYLQHLGPCWSHFWGPTVPDNKDFTAQLSWTYVVAMLGPS
jgi:hypothetical protein